MPCPVVFDDEDVRETMELDAALSDADKSLQRGQNIVGIGSEGWVPKDHYERAMARNKKLLTILTKKSTCNKLIFCGFIILSAGVFMVDLPVVKVRRVVLVVLRVSCSFITPSSVDRIS